MSEKNVSAGQKGRSQGDVVALSVTETSMNGLGKGQVNWAYQQDTPMSDSDSGTGCHGDDSTTQVSHNDDEETGRAHGSGTHSIILDISTTSFVDTVTVKTLKNVRVCVDMNNLTLRCLKGQFTPESNIHIFPLTCSAIYQSRFGVSCLVLGLNDALNVVLVVSSLESSSYMTRLTTRSCATGS